MGKLYDKLQRQLKSEEYKKDAEDCLKIYEKLKELNNGSVWDSDWRQLTTIGGWIGDKYPKTMVYKPSKLGYELLKGIKEKKEREASCKHSDWTDLYYSSGDYYGRYCNDCGEFFE